MMPNDDGTLPLAEPDPGVWVGLRRCGCCVAVVVDEPNYPKDVNATKREFLRDGLSVVYGTWDEWLTKYQPSLKRKCGHQ
jgi:hypothetical protein